MSEITTNVFRQYEALGYGLRLLPVIPPNAPISPTSSLAKRKDARGKAVGVKGRDGNWHGLDWIPYTPDEHDLDRWHAMGAGLGIKTGDGLVAIDADTTNEEWARTIRDEVRAIIGHTPIRVGRYPKALYLVKVAEPYRYARVEFGERSETGSLKERVEILSDGRQFVAHGVHPSTGKPYTWPAPLVSMADLPTVSAGQLDLLLNTLRGKLPAAAEIKREGAASDVNQAALKGDLETVRKAVAAIPNTSEHFPTRESYRDFGYAIKAALPDYPNEAFAIFEDWCARWKEGSNDPGVVAADWRRMKPPFRRGAGWVYELAETLNPKQFSTAEAWFEDFSSGENPFAEIDLNLLKGEDTKTEAERMADRLRATAYSFPDPAAIPKREWLYGAHYIRQFVSTTVAPSGVGKSSLSIVEALAMASGKPLLGVQPKGVFRVWLWNGEDPRDELHRRVAAAMMHYGLARADLEGRLFIDTGRETEIILAHETREGVVIREPVERAVLREIEANAIDVKIVDPFVSSHRVTENDNGAIDLVTKRWARIADRGRCSIELVHHVRKLNGGEVTVEDGRGAVALLATSRSARAIAKLGKGEAVRLGLESKVGRLFRFADGKNNLALPAGEGTQWFELASVALGNGRGDGLDGVIDGDSVGVVTRFDGVPDERIAVGGDQFEAAMEELKNGEWRRDSRAGEAWAGCVIARCYSLDLDDAADKARAKVILSQWVKQGRVKEVTKRDAARRMRTFVEPVIQDKLSEIDEIF